MEKYVIRNLRKSIMLIPFGISAGCAQGRVSKKCLHNITPGKHIQAASTRRSHAVARCQSVANLRPSTCWDPRMFPRVPLDVAGMFCEENAFRLWIDSDL
jgi:hypothetical protein